MASPGWGFYFPVRWSGGTALGKLPLGQGAALGAAQAQTRQPRERSIEHSRAVAQRSSRCSGQMAPASGSEPPRGVAAQVAPRRHSVASHAGGFFMRCSFLGAL